MRTKKTLIRLCVCTGEFIGCTYQKVRFLALRLIVFLAYIHRIYPKYSDTSTPYHICSKIWTSTIHYPMLCQKIAGWMANSVDPVETPRSAASHLGLNCLLKPVCPNTYGKYGKYNWLSAQTLITELTLSADLSQYPFACPFINIPDFDISMHSYASRRTKKKSLDL